MKQITSIRLKYVFSLVLIFAFGSSSFGDIVELTPFENEASSGTFLNAGGPFTFSLNDLLLSDSENTIQFFALNDNGPIGVSGDFVIRDVTATAIPEPSTTILLLLACNSFQSVALLSTRRRRQ